MLYYSSNRNYKGLLVNGSFESIIVIIILVVISKIMCQTQGWFQEVNPPLEPRGLVHIAQIFFVLMIYALQLQP